MTTDERLRKASGNGAPATHWLGMQAEQIQKFMDTLAYRRSGKAFRRALHQELCELTDAFKIAQSTNLY